MPSLSQSSVTYVAFSFSSSIAFPIAILVHSSINMLKSFFSSPKTTTSSYAPPKWLTIILIPTDLSPGSTNKYSL